MKITYDQGMDSAHAEGRLIKIAHAVRASKLEFKVDKVYKGNGFAITVETPFSIFDSYHDMQDYVRSLIVNHNETLHAEDDYLRVKGALDGKS